MRVEAPCSEKIPFGRPPALLKKSLNRVLRRQFCGGRQGSFDRAVAFAMLRQLLRPG